MYLLKLQMMMSYVVFGKRFYILLNFVSVGKIRIAVCPLLEKFLVTTLVDTDCAMTVVAPSCCAIELPTVSLRIYTSQT